MEKFLSQLEELDNYVQVIDDLDSQNEEIQRQIAVLKDLQNRELNNSLQKDSQQEFRLKSLPHDKEAAQDAESLHQQSAEQYMKQRKIIAHAFTEKSSVAKLFTRHKGSVLAEVEHTTISDGLCFSHPILNPLMVLSHQFVKAFLVEVNLKNALGNKEIASLIHPDSILLHEDLFAFMSHDNDKEELLSKLYALRDGKKSESSPWNVLDENTVAELSRDFSDSEAFRNNGLQRYDLLQHLSGRWLNYEHSDTLASIQASHPPRFASSVFNSEEYIREMREVFSRYNLTQEPNRKPILLLQLAKALAAGGDCIPTCSVFEFLLDSFGKSGLYNYQSMVYDVLPAFQFHQFAYADSPHQEGFAPNSSTHFEHLIEEYPEFLATLMEYQVPRNNSETFQHLLEYFELSTSASLATLSILPTFSRAVGSNPLGLLEKGSEVSVGLNTIARVLESCVKMHDYPALDKILNKLILNLRQTTDGVRIILNAVKDENTLIYKKAPNSIPSLIFNEKILLLLGGAYLEMRDRKRARWLMPHVQFHLKESKSKKLSDLSGRLTKILGDSKAASQSVPTRINSRDLFGPKLQSTVPVMA